MGKAGRQDGRKQERTERHRRESSSQAGRIGGYHDGTPEGTSKSLMPTVLGRGRRFPDLEAGGRISWWWRRWWYKRRFVVVVTVVTMAEVGGNGGGGVMVVVMVVHMVVVVVAATANSGNW